MTSGAMGVSNTLSVLSGALGGTAAGAAVAGAAGSNVGTGALAGLASAAIVGLGSKVWPLGAAAIAGGAASEIEGGEFGEGVRFAAIGRSMGTMLELAVPAETIAEQNPQPGDLAFMKPRNPLTALISIFEGGSFSHVKMLDDTGRWISATPGKGVDYFSYDAYSGRRGKVVRRFRGNQRVIAVAKAQAVTNPPLPYNYVVGGRGRVCSTACGNAISVGAGVKWTGIGPNSQYNTFRSYGE
jgi:hypothetical protein